MKTRIGYTVKAFIAALILLGTMTAHSAPPEKKPRSDLKTSESNAIPQSVFTTPTSPQEGRDPFFPNSVRLSGAVSTKSTPSSGVVTLTLNGLSGTADHRLAIINGRTFAEGEENEVTTSSGRVRIRCVQIKGETVVVEVGGERQELRFRD